MAIGLLSMKTSPDARSVHPVGAVYRASKLAAGAELIVQHLSGAGVGSLHSGRKPARFCSMPRMFIGPTTRAAWNVRRSSSGTRPKSANSRKIFTLGRCLAEPRICASTEQRYAP